jgi:transcriptional regulator
VYVPAHFREARREVVLDLLRGAGFGHLVCTDDHGPISTPLPFLVDEALTSVRAHVARANGVWRLAPRRALLIVPVADAYVSPSWYPSKADGGRVVPTWNYEVVHLTGDLVVRDDPAWIRRQIDDLTTRHESARAEPWAVDDAPADFVDGLMRSIVGIELVVDRVEAKRKLSQNRSGPDRAGVEQGLRADGDRASRVADAMDPDDHE